MTKREKANYLIRSVTHALDVMDELAAYKGEMGVTQLSQKLGLHKNNIFRLLATLTLRGYVEQNPSTEEYSLGSSCLKLGQAYLLQNDLISRIRPVLLKLSEETGETVSFAKLINYEVTYPISIAPKKPVCVSPRVGNSFSPKSYSVGRLLLCQLPDAEIQELSSSNQMLGTLIKGQVAELKSAGMLCDRGQTESDVLCISRIIRGLNNTVLGAVEISAPMYRAKIQELQPALDKAANTITGFYAGAAGSALKEKIEKENLVDRAEVRA